MTNENAAGPGNDAREPADHEPHNQPTHVDDPESRATPGGVVGDLVEEAEDGGGSADPADSPIGRSQLDAPEQA